MNNYWIVYLKGKHLFFKSNPLLSSGYWVIYRYIILTVHNANIVLGPVSLTGGKVEPFTEDHYCCQPNIGRGPLDDVIH